MPPYTAPSIENIWYLAPALVNFQDGFEQTALATAWNTSGPCYPLECRQLKQSQHCEKLTAKIQKNHKLRILLWNLLFSRSRRLRGYICSPPAGNIALACTCVCLWSFYCQSGIKMFATCVTLKLRAQMNVPNPSSWGILEVEMQLSISLSRASIYLFYNSRAVHPKNWPRSREKKHALLKK